MKNLKKYLVLPFVGLALTGCNDLDSVYQGAYVTGEQKKEVLELNPEMAKAGVLGIANNFNLYCSYSTNHFDFGFPALMMALDSRADDMPARYFGYNWFWSFQALTDNNPDGRTTNFVWNIIYAQILVSNTVISSMDVESDNPEIQILLAQGYAFRAFDYFFLAQLYQRNYEGREDMPCIPLLTNENSEEVAVDGAPRASVQETYDFILSDLNTAIQLVEKSGLTVDAITSSKPRRMFNLDALYGLRARIHLVMHKYAEAAADASKVIEMSACYPLSIAECSKPGFNAFEHNWLFGDAVAETDRVVTSGLINFPSHMCSFAYGYVDVGAFRCINAKLYEEMAASDVRKGWFLDANYESPILDDAHRAYLNTFDRTTMNDDDDSHPGIMPYQNVKFDSYQGVMNQSINASDIPLMRIEEMYYIKAEAEAMSQGLAAGQATLTNFETTYRNPSYVATATSAADLQEEIWKLRRVEFWGEGLSWFDLLRLNKGIDRTGGNFPAVFNYRIENDNPNMILPLPFNEIQYNKALTPDDNNPNGDRPTPVKE